MIKITRPAATRVDIEIDGTVDADFMRQGLDLLFGHAEDIRHGQMYFKISNFSLPTLGAIGVEMARLPKMFGLLGKFDRCAVLSDSGWLRTAAEIEGKILPGLKIKSFDLADSAAANAWLAGKSDASAA